MNPQGSGPESSSLPGAGGERGSPGSETKRIDAVKNVIERDLGEVLKNLRLEFNYPALSDTNVLLFSEAVEAVTKFFLEIVRIPFDEKAELCDAIRRACTRGHKNAQIVIDGCVVVLRDGRHVHVRLDFSKTDSRTVYRVTDVWLEEV